MEPELTRESGASALLRVAPLFARWHEMLTEPALEGRMGAVWTWGGEERAALCETGDFLLLAGSADSLACERLAEAFATDGRFHILVARGEALQRRLSQLLAGRAATGLRYAFPMGEAVFDPSALERVAPPPGVTLRRFNGALYREALAQERSRDFCSLFASEAEYLAQGVGIAALCEGRLVGGASSYTRCGRGIEIQVATQEAYQRRGIARACAARLILTCLSMGLYPSWDAANFASQQLALELGYRSPASYPVWFLNE